MPNVKITPQFLTSDCQKFSNASNEINSINNYVAHLVSSLDWEVRGKGNVESLIDQAAALGKTMSQETLRLSQYLNNCAQSMDAADAKLKTNIEKFTGSLPAIIGIGVIGVGIGLLPITPLPWIIGIIKPNPTPTPTPVITPQPVIPKPSPKWPVDGGKVIPNRGFGARSSLPGDKGVTGHTGIDIGNADGGLGVRGTPINNVFSGKVVWAGYSSSYGNVVYIDTVIDGKQYQIRYAHLDSISPEVINSLKSGAPMDIGASIGKMGDTPGLPWCDGVHLHFEIRESVDGSACGVGNGSSIPVDPIPFLN